MSAAPLRQIVLDTETTGLNPLHPDHPDRLIEFAGLEMVNRQFTGNNLHLLVHPQRDIPEEAAKIHNITLDKLTGKPVFAQVAQQIFDFIEGAELIIHNAKFDIGFLDMEFARVGLPNVESVCSVIDTLAMAKEKYVGQRNSLDALCVRLGVDRSKRVFHGALIDCELLGEVYLAMTRRQFSLIDDLDDTPSAATAAVSAHIPAVSHTFERSGSLKVILADENEVREHEAILTEMENKLEKPCLYHQTFEEIQADIIAAAEKAKEKAAS